MYTGKVKKRLCLVLDCLIAHEFEPQSMAYINLQQYVIKEKKLRECEALLIFRNIVSIVERLHKVSIEQSEHVHMFKPCVMFFFFFVLEKHCPS